MSDFPSPTPGWIGTAEQIDHYLTTIGADKDEEGRFKIYFPADDGPPVSFLGLGDEFVLHGSEDYSVDGERRNLANGLREAEVGLGVMVI